MAKAKRKKKRSVIGTIIWWIIILVAIGVFGYSTYKLGSIWWEYRKGTEEYDDLKQYISNDSGSATVDNTEGTGEDGGEVPAEEPGPAIDFASLQEVNSDIIGWLQVEALEDINYPIVQGKDNDYYLHRTTKKTYNFAGSIFLEYQNKPDFSEPHSIVFGHNMKNGSMFGQLDKFRKPEVYNKSRYFWICTPERNYKYEIFSVQDVLSGGEAYTLFYGPSKEVVDYVNQMKSTSEVKFPDMVVTENSKIVTLSTCTTTTVNRLIVQGILVN